MNATRRLAIAVASLFLAVLSVHAAEPTVPVAPVPARADAVVPAYMDAIRVGDWPKAGALMHPEALAEIRQVFLALSSTDPSGQAAQQLFLLKEGETVEALEPSDLFARFMSALVTQTDGLKELLASTRVETLGSVAESSGLSHVVYRMTRTGVGTAPVVQVEVMTIKKAGSDWRSMVPPELQGILSSIRSSIAQREAMLQQMQQQMLQQNPQPEKPVPQLDLTTDPPPDTH